MDYKSALIYPASKLKSKKTELQYTQSKRLRERNPPQYQHSSLQGVLEECVGLVGHLGKWNDMVEIRLIGQHEFFFYGDIS
jgi:hypothetical protein